MKLLSEYGVKNLRVFPNWRDFQPVERASEWCGLHGEYINAKTGEPVYDDGVDMEMIEHFRDFCRAAEKMGKPVEEVLFLDDNYNAAKTGKQAGMRVCGVYDATAEDYVDDMKNTADYYIYNFLELLEL